MSKGRAEAFSDGVFAVAATLLVFSIPTPDAHGFLLMTVALIPLSDRPAGALPAIRTRPAGCGRRVRRDDVGHGRALAVYAATAVFYMVFPLLREAQARRASAGR